MIWVLRIALVWTFIFLTKVYTWEQPNPKVFNTSWDCLRSSKSLERTHLHMWREAKNFKVLASDCLLQYGSKVKRLPSTQENIHHAQIVFPLVRWQAVWLTKDKNLTWTLYKLAIWLFHGTLKGRAFILDRENSFSLDEFREKREIRRLDIAIKERGKREKETVRPIGRRRGD